MKIANKIIFQQIEEIVASGGEVELRIKGHSMRPLLRDHRDIVVLRKICARDFKVGVVVLFRYKDRHILHRIIYIDGDNLIVAGDGNYKIYEYCTKKDVVAAADSVIRKSGKRAKCSSLYWRCASQLWVWLPQIVRRYTLAILWRLGYK